MINFSPIEIRVKLEDVYTEMGWTTTKGYLYPTQRVAEGIMFLTRPSVRQSVSPSVLFFLLAQLLWNRSTEFRETL